MCGVCSRLVSLSGVMTPFETTTRMELHEPLMAASNLFPTFKATVVMCILIYLYIHLYFSVCIRVSQAQVKDRETIS